ncbi:glycoside hydrolase family 65 protein [Fervidibacillus halotolerans]|uniref:Glycoside hydrolase family 65 protein n=1 Tax=Fervidibacillus halotolerans TaxID=2980027 RepID=A0A9E8RZD5_9BACI|nr:glycoside hydrolase family 65 protein [Fervidibacillus halotolerans]WAA13049.1 glycoside hydrolase family 65 protein [Fervidibacillus halotolerans]
MGYLRLFEIDEWKIRTKQLSKEHKRLQESLISIGNGYMGMRGNFEEDYSGDHHQGVYIAGVWFPDKTRVGWWKNGYPEYFGKVINTVNFLKTNIYINGEKVDLFVDQLHDFHLELNMKTGVLYRDFTIEKHGLRYRIQVERFVSLDVKELCAVNISVTSLDADADIKIVSALDGDVRNEDANYDEMFWMPVKSEKRSLVVETKPNPFGIEQFSVAVTMENRTSNLEKQSDHVTDLEVSESFLGTVLKGEKATLEKRIIVTTSRDYEKEKVLSAGKKILDEIGKFRYDELKESHERLWEKRWERADVTIGGDPANQQGIRFNIFQLFSTYYGEDKRLNIGPKGFTGEKYGGATYWDTEAFVFPFYLATADPSVAKHLLEYRYEQLPQAYDNAKKLGLKGALYPMVTFNGVECHNEWEITFEEIHRNGAIAYAIYNYTNYTGDQSYLVEKGIDVLVGISRFWADRVHFHKEKQVYMIHGVTGPNEYENNVNNNWYTNYIAVWTLKYTLEALKLVSKEKRLSLNITDEETKDWQHIIDHMYFPYDEKRKIYVQHDTFLDKELKTVQDLSSDDLPLNQKWSWDKILRSCFIKQADVLQGIYFFGDHFTMEEKRRHFEFYEPMTVHESSLSPSVHTILAAELRRGDKAVELYERTARLDLDNYNNDTEDGLHITSMTGGWLAIVQGFAGMRTYNGQLSFAPIIPKKWTDYSFHVNYRNRLLFVHVKRDETSITLVKGDPLVLNMYEKSIEVQHEYKCKTEIVE